MDCSVVVLLSVCAYATGAQAAGKGPLTCLQASVTIGDRSVFLLKGFLRHSH